MPTYDYECRSCGRITEVIHAMTEEGPSVCEHCGGSLRRVLYPAGIIFKGSGFYRTDSRANGDKGSSTGSTGSTGAGASSSGEGATGGSSDSGRAGGSTTKASDAT